MDELVGGEGEVDVLGRLLPLNVDGLFVRLGRLPVQRSWGITHWSHRSNILIIVGLGHKLTYENHKSVPKEFHQLLVADLSTRSPPALRRPPSFLLLRARPRPRRLTKQSTCLFLLGIVFICWELRLADKVCVVSVLFERVLVDIVFDLPLLINSLLPKRMVALKSSRTLHSKLDILWFLAQWDLLPRWNIAIFLT